MTRPGARAAAAALPVLALLVAVGASACSIGSASDGAGTPDPAGSSAPPAAPEGPLLPTATAAAATTSASPEPSAPTAPPAAMLRGPGVRSAPGVIGGYAYGDSGSAAPWIPASALEAVTLPPAASLELSLDPELIAGWSLRTSSVTDTLGEEPRPLAEGAAPAASGSIQFTGPPVGRWVLEARISYAGGLGDGAYYWLLDVRPP